jgi:hypothetical protein
MKLILAIISCSLLTCTNTNPKNEKGKEKVEDNFYVNKGSYDAIRIPLIKPYELIKLNGSSEWTMNLWEVPGSVSNVKEISVKNKLIMIHADETYCNNNKVKEAWIVINPAKKIEQCFDHKKGFEDFLTSLQLNPETLYVPDKVYEKFNANGKVVWE